MKTKLLQGLLLCVALISVSYADMNPRIVGGIESPEAYSWMVSIQGKDESNHFCGGTLIASNWVVTAAHCTDGAIADKMKVVIGMKNLDEAQLGETHLVSAIYDHIDFNFPKDLDNDISLLKLSSHSALTPLEIISPADFSQIEAGSLLTTIGWGALAEFQDPRDAEFPNTLMEVQLPLVSPENCREVYPNDFDSSDNPLCAGGNEKDSCQGDSGGPLIANIDGTNYLVGVVSWGYGCARKGIYGIYTNVSEQIEWLEQFLSGNFLDVHLKNNFFSIGMGELTTQALTFTNTGDEAITMTSFNVDIGGEYLSIEDIDCLNIEIEAGGDCQIMTTITVSGINSPRLRISLIGLDTAYFNLEIDVMDKMGFSFLNEQKLNWYSSGHSKWFQPADFCQLISGDIEDEQVSKILVHFTGTVIPKFNIFMSSEDIYDRLEVSIDDEYKGLSYSGDASAELDILSYELEDSAHRVLFKYIKDVSFSQNLDQATITQVEVNDIAGLKSCEVDNQSRSDSIIGSSGGGSVFYLLLPLLLLNFKRNKAV